MDDASKHQPRVSLPSLDEVKPLLRKFWPHRTHESNWLKDVACRLGQHRWYAMTLNDSVSGLRLAPFADFVLKSRWTACKALPATPSC